MEVRTRLQLEQVEESHVFLPVNLYVCTLSRGCFSDLGHHADTDGEASVMNLDQAKLDLATTQSLKLTEAAKSFICNLLKSIDTSVSVEIMQPRSDTASIEPIVIDIAKPGPACRRLLV